MHRRNTLKLGLGLLAAGFLPRAWSTDSKNKLGLEVDFVATPNEIVDAMLQLANVKQRDVVYDLGCGDGRIVIAAAKKFGARGVGIDIDPDRIKEANENARKAGVADRVRFVEGDLFEADFRDATVVALFLKWNYNRKLRPRLWAQLKPGTPVVSHEHDFGSDWPPAKQVVIAGKTVYLYVVPAKT
ncbi:MAG TPA: class I SAM-dependent methyltransferase [Burkholderiales bacterium]|jgi:SAM-dependent methyltransferase|nr:class I SAM-dependent methyltransferase [Burkholderiales bacterium]